MDRNPYAAPASEVETPTQGPVSTARYGLLCFITLLVLLAAYITMSRLAGRAVSPGVGIVELIASVQFASWRFVRTHRRVMSRSELKHFALSCGLAFWVFDEVPALIRRFLTVGVGVSRAVFTALVASAFDVALAAAIVYVTVPRPPPILTSPDHPIWRWPSEADPRAALTRPARHDARAARGESTALAIRRTGPTPPGQVNIVLPVLITQQASFHPLEAGIPTGLLGRRPQE